MITLAWPLTLAGPLLADRPVAGQLAVVRREALAHHPWSAEEARRICGHGGVGFYEDGPTPRYTISEFIGGAHALGVRHVKTWPTGARPGEMRERLARPDDSRILSEFDTVLSDVCPNFTLQGPYAAAKAQTIREEYAGVPEELANRRRRTKTTLLLSLFMATNLMFGAERSHAPGFQVDRFPSDADDGIGDGIARARRTVGDGDRPRIHTAIEVAGLPRDCIRRFLPRLRADLCAISHDGRCELGQPDRPLRERIRELAAAVPRDGPSVRRSLILGELGRSVLAGASDGDERERLRYLRRPLCEARRADLPGAFVFRPADQERTHDDGWGFVASKPSGGALRRSGHAFRAALADPGPPARPAGALPSIDAIRIHSVGQLASVEIDVAYRSRWGAGATDARGLRPRLDAGDQADGFAPSPAPNRADTRRASLRAPAAEQIPARLTGQGIEATRTEPLGKADLVVDRVCAVPAEPRVVQPMRRVAVVRNCGGAPITDFAVRFHVDGFRETWVGSSGVHGETRPQLRQSPPIAGGFLWTATPGGHRARAWANPDGLRERNDPINVGHSEIWSKPCGEGALPGRAAPDAPCTTSRGPVQ